MQGEVAGGGKAGRGVAGSSGPQRKTAPGRRADAEGCAPLARAHTLMGMKILATVTAVPVVATGIATGEWMCLVYVAVVLYAIFGWRPGWRGVTVPRLDRTRLEPRDHDIARRALRLGASNER